MRGPPAPAEVSQVQGPGFGAVLGPRSRRVQGSDGLLEVSGRVRRPPPPGPDHRGHRRERFGGKHRAHLAVAGLPAADAGNRPEFREQPGAIRIDREGGLTGQLWQSWPLPYHSI